MRRTVAIFFLTLFLLNIIGYYGVFMGLKYSLEQQVVDQLDADAYGEEELVEFKVAVALPYMPDQPNYERVDGLIDVEGKFYRMVKQRYAGDTLYLVCIPDHDQQKIHKALEEYVQTFASPDSSKSKQLDFSKSLSKDYLPVLASLENASFGGYYEIGIQSYVVSNYSAYLPVFSPPPQG